MIDGEHLVFPINEYQRRLDELRERMRERYMDAVIITEPENITYLTGYQTTGYSYFQAIIVPIDQEPFMVTRLLEESNIFARTWVEYSHPYGDTGNAIQELWSSMNEYNLVDGRTIGYEKNSYFFPVYQQERFVDTFSTANTRLTDCSGIVELGRMTKSDLEIDLMRKAAHATVEGMRAGIEAAEVGISENDLAAEIHYAMYKAGGEYPAVAPYITSGPRTNIGHATWEGRTLQNDECVFLEVGGCVKRYHTAMMRTIFLGKPSAKVLDAEKVVLDALAAGMEAIRAGVTIHEVDSVMRSWLSLDSSGGKLITRTGYSIGIAFAPSWDEGQILSLKPGENTYLQENMTFHIIPWLVGVDTKHMMGISETVRVLEGGCESFFNFPRNLVQKNEKKAGN